MNILEITFNPPELHSGGGIGIYQSIVSLKNNAHIDYIGPKFDETLFDEDEVKVLYILRKSKSLKNIIGIIKYQATTSYLESWLNILPYIDWMKYDFIHLEFSRYAFIIADAHKYGKKVIVREHNIETDYSKNIYIHRKTFFNLLRHISFYVNEKKTMGIADFVIFITKNDRQRANRLFQRNNDEDIINPICIDRTDHVLKRKSKNSDFVNVLLTGSLDYDANVSGILWFLHNVVVPNTNLFERIRVIIAGKNPKSDLISYASLFKNVKVIANPKSMSTFFNNADIFVAPVFDGAGMKVKVAEALSYGIPVIGTSHAIIGYEMIQNGIYRADDEETFINCLKTLMDNNSYLKLSNYILKDFDHYLSMKSSSSRYKELLERYDHH